jgi:RNA recognition motif-containing protein
MQKNKLFMGGLAWATTEDSLREACEEFGEIVEVRVIMDRETGRSKGFGFVTFATDEQAARAKNELDGKIIDGRAIKVDFPREREDRGPRGGGFGGGGGGYDRGGQDRGGYDRGFDRGDRRY